MFSLFKAFNWSFTALSTLAVQILIGLFSETKALSYALPLSEGMLCQLATLFFSKTRLFSTITFFECFNFIIVSGMKIVESQSSETVLDDIRSKM